MRFKTSTKNYDVGKIYSTKLPLVGELNQSLKGLVQIPNKMIDAHHTKRR
jgi:hypothetical protein